MTEAQAQAWREWQDADDDARHEVYAVLEAITATSYRPSLWDCVWQTLEAAESAPIPKPRTRPRAGAKGRGKP